MSLTRRQLAALAAAAALPAARPSFAQARYPSRPVRIVVPFGAGGIADLTARVVAQKLGERLGGSVIVDNRPGAGGVAAGELVARAEPDGHTLLLVSNGTAVSAGLFKHLPFDAQKDFAPVGLVGTFDLGVVVAKESRFATLADLLAAARANPGKLNLATINVGSTQNLAAELFKTTAGLKLQVVPFNGTPAVVTALRSGEVDAAVEILGPLKGQLSSGALRVLAVMGAARPVDMPNAARVADSGGALAGFDVASWNGLAAPAATPADIVVHLNRELRAVLGDAAVQQKLAELGVQARFSRPDELGALLAAETKRWGAVIQRAGIPRQ